MAVPEGPTEKRYAANGVTTSFTIPFLLLGAGDLKVYLNDLEVTSGFTLTGVGLPQSTITFVTAPSGILLLQLNVPFERLNDYQENGDFLSSTVNRDFDRIWQALKQLLRYSTRALSLGFFDVDGSGFYRAKGNGIINLASANKVDDAATNWKDVSDLVSEVLQTGQGPVNNAANILYVNPAGVPAVLQGLVGSMITGNLTITVPAQFAETADAMDWLRTKTIVNGAQVTIQLTASFTPTRSTNLNHSQGGQISILGSAANPTAIRALAITPLSFDGFVCSGGNNFGLLDNFVVDATSKSEAPLNYSGIVATDGARIGCGPGMLVNNYYYSFVGRDGGVTFADSTNATNAGDVAYWGFNGGHVRARNAVGTNARDVANGLGSIFLSEYGGSVDCTGATASGALLSGIAALSGGSTRAYNSTSTGNDGDGFLARDGGVIVAHNATASSNGGYGIAQITNGRVLGNNMIFTSNALGINRPAVVLDNTSLGARLAASGGILRIDTGTGGFNTNFHSSGGLILSLLHSDSAVNNVYLAGSPTGGPVRLGATGSDTNIDIRFQTKGTGVLRYGTHTSNADAAISGYITIRDDGGTLRKLAVIS